MMSEGYRYRKAGRIRIGDGILLKSGKILWVAHIEANESDAKSLIFVDGKNDVATMLVVDDVVRISKDHHTL